MPPIFYYGDHSRDCPGNQSVLVKERLGGKYADKKILEKYVRLGGAMITIGSDAHTPGADFEYVRELLREFPQCQVGYFAQRHFIPLEPKSLYLYFNDLVVCPEFVEGNAVRYQVFGNSGLLFQNSSSLFFLLQIYSQVRYMVFRTSTDIH